ncbi:hypothetical protein MLD38_036636 [Melastoma candidum]|uniref:Uncharacterized protein n=1 Tax=Melastoma candidum TaxID=119954 RepID=A0ACB9LKI6_9MYRT|nr:hypothetical protein MLD38_036636 [Melastoma candidum]
MAGIIPFAFVLFSIISISYAINDPKSVVIKNDLGSGLVLAFRCLSADDDLGVHLLPPGESWGFHFKTRFIGNTLFHCGFKWALADEKKFTVYDDNQHHYTCSECVWSIQRNSTCLTSNAITASLCYPWSPGWPTPTPDGENTS